MTTVDKSLHSEYNIRTWVFTIYQNVSAGACQLYAKGFLYNHFKVMRIHQEQDTYSFQ